MPDWCICNSGLQSSMQTLPGPLAKCSCWGQLQVPTPQAGPHFPQPCISGAEEPFPSRRPCKTRVRPWVYRLSFGSGLKKWDWENLHKETPVRSLSPVVWRSLTWWPFPGNTEAAMVLMVLRLCNLPSVFCEVIQVQVSDSITCRASSCHPPSPQAGLAQKTPRAGARRAGCLNLSILLPTPTFVLSAWIVSSNSGQRQTFLQRQRAEDRSFPSPSYHVRGSWTRQATRSSGSWKVSEQFNVVPNRVKEELFIDEAALNASYKAVHIFKVKNAYIYIDAL